LFYHFGIGIDIALLVPRSATQIVSPAGSTAGTPSYPDNLRFATQAGDFDLRALTLPLNVRIAQLKKKGSVAIDAIVYYCTTEGSACFGR